MRYSIAALVCLLGGCGNDNRGTIDGGDGDGAVDADIDANPNVRGMVTVHTVDKLGLPLAGLDVVFIDTDQTVTALKTDAAGAAQASVFPNASVTVERVRSSTPPAYYLTTVLALNPGDDILLQTEPSNASSADDPFDQRVLPLPSADVIDVSKGGSTGTFTTIQPHGLAVGDAVVVSGMTPSAYNTPLGTTWTVATTPSTTTFTANIGSGNPGAVTAPGAVSKVLPFTFNYATYAGAQGYIVYTSCGSTDVGTSLAPTLNLKTGCTAASMSVVVVAYGAGTTPLAYAQKTGLTITAGGNTTISDTWHAIGSVAATYSNATTRVTDVQLERYIPYVRTAAAGSGSTTTASGMVSVASPATATAVMKSRLRCLSGTDCISNGIGTASQVFSQEVDGTLSTYSLDIGANLLPWVSAIYTQAAKTVDVTVTGTGAIDLQQVYVGYSGMPGSSPRDTYIYRWRVFGPTAGTVTFPTLPSTLPGDPTLRPSDVQSTTSVWLCETDSVNGYRNAIKNVYQTLSTCEMNPSTTTKPATATKSRLSQWN